MSLARAIQEIVWLPNNHLSGMRSITRGANAELHKAYARKVLRANWEIVPPPGMSAEALIERIADSYAAWMGDKEAWSYETGGIGDPSLDEIVANLCVRCRNRGPVVRAPVETPPLWAIFASGVPRQAPEGSGWLWLALGVGAFAFLATRKDRKGRRR